MITKVISSNIKPVSKIFSSQNIMLCFNFVAIFMGEKIIHYLGILESLSSI